MELNIENNNKSHGVLGALERAIGLRIERVGDGVALIQRSLLRGDFILPLNGNVLSAFYFFLFGMLIYTFGLILKYFLVSKLYGFCF